MKKFDFLIFLLILLGDTVSLGEKRIMDNISDKVKLTKGWLQAETLWGKVLQALEMSRLTKALEKPSHDCELCAGHMSGARWEFCLHCGRHPKARC